VLGATYGSSAGGGAGAAIGPGGGAVGAGACCALWVLEQAASSAKAEAMNNGLASLTTVLS
jgi:hypothetical protein